MRRARKNGAYYHPDWSPHIRYEMYQGLFNRCFGLGEFDACRLLLKWGNGRSIRTETAADFTTMIPLLLCVVRIEETRKSKVLQFSLLDATDEAQAKNGYDKFRRLRDDFPIETEIAYFLYKTCGADAATFPELKDGILTRLSELKETSFYYANLMHYFHFEGWIRGLRVDRALAERS